MISDKPNDYGIHPTSAEAETARLILDWDLKFHPNDHPVATCKNVVEFCADKFTHDSPDWKNSLMFELIGAQMYCTFK